MAIHLLLLHMTLALFLSIHKASAQEISLAKPGCQERCGSLKISYPFGIGTNCAADQTFQIHCNNSFNPPKAFLNDNSLEVLQISPETGTVQVNNPVLSNCGDKSNDQKLLSSGPFTFSDTQNRFTAMGCETLGVITQEGLRVGGCITFCNSTTINSDNTCFGFCCQTRIPPFINFINASVRSIDPIKYQNICRQAFVADQNWFKNLTNIFSVRSMDYVPAVLDWRLPVSCSYQKSVYNRPDIELCDIEDNTFCTEQGLCSCLEGYQGNPYLPNGCQGKFLQ